MKKKLVCLLLAAVLLLVLTSCDSTPIPYGKWENAYLNIMMDINPEELIEEAFYPGQIMYKGEPLQVFIIFARHVGRLEIYDPKYYDISTGRLRADNPYFSGDYELKDGKLYYKLKPHWQELTGIQDTIIFEQTAEYQAPEE